MQKFIRTLAIIATALIGISLLLLLLSILFQRPIATNIYNYPVEETGLLPQIPVPPILICFLRLVCVALLIVCCGNKKGGIWLETVIVISLIVVIPGINTIVSLVYNRLILNIYGVDGFGIYSIAREIATYCLIPSSLGQPIAYIVCGMSIAFKHMNKKMDQAVLEAKIKFAEMKDLEL